MTVVALTDLFMNADNRTGISVQSGIPLREASELPPYLLEIWKFANDHEASVFIAGLQLSGFGNTILYDRNLGSLTSNSTVIVGRLDQVVSVDAPLDERLVVRTVERLGADAEVIASSNRKASDERTSQSQRERAEMERVIEAMGQGSYDAYRWGSGWLSARSTSMHVSVAWTSPSGPFRISSDVQELGLGNLDVRERMVSMAQQCEFRIDEGWELHFAQDIPDQETLRGALAAMDGLIDNLMAERKRLYRQDFLDKTKMSAKWARMILAGRDSSIPTSVVRQMERAEIGDDQIGRTAIHTLLSVGWVERGRFGLIPTTAGIEAAEAKLGRADEFKNS